MELHHSVIRDWLVAAVALGADAFHFANAPWVLRDSAAPHPCIVRGELRNISFSSGTVTSLGIVAEEGYAETSYALMPVHEIGGLRKGPRGYRQIIAVGGSYEGKRIKVWLSNRGNHFLSSTHFHDPERYNYEPWTPPGARAVAEERLREAIINYGRFQEALQFPCPAIYPELVKRADQGPLIWRTIE